MAKDTQIQPDPLSRYRAALEAMYFTRQADLLKVERKLVELPSTALKEQTLSLRGELGGIRKALDELQAIHLDSQIQTLNF